MSTSDGGDDWKRKYLGLKRKYTGLYDETFKLSEKLFEAHNEARRLKLEKKFLLKTIESMEASGSRSGRIKKAKKPSPETAKIVQAAAAQLHGVKGKKNTEGKDSSAVFTMLVDSDIESPRGGDKESDALGSKGDAQPAVDLALICTAVLAPGRSCKTKRLPGSVYCWRHAALDPNSTSTYCRFADPDTHKKCSNTIPKNKKPLLCAHHVHKAASFLTDESIMNGATEAEISAMLATLAAKAASSATTAAISLDD